MFKIYVRRQAVICCSLSLAIGYAALASSPGETQEVVRAYATTTRLMRFLTKEDEKHSAQRIRFHLLIRSGDKAGATNLWEELRKSSNIGIEKLLIPFVLPNTVDKEVYSEINAVLHSGKSPSLYLLECDRIERDSHGSITVESSVLGVEPYWEPALRRNIRKPGWLIAALYGSVLLDLTDADSPPVDGFLRLMRREKSGTAPYDRARALLMLKDFRQDIEAESQFWDTKHSQDKTRLEAALIYHSGHQSEALTLYQEMVKDGIARGSTYYRLARLYESQGRQEDAEATINVGLNKFPEKNSILLVTAAEYAVKRGDVDKAIVLLNKCLAASPEYPPAHILLAELEAERGNRDAAIKACADTLAFCYGWDGDFLDRVNGVLEKLVQLQEAQKEKETGK